MKYYIFRDHMQGFFSTFDIQPPLMFAKLGPSGNLVLTQTKIVFSYYF